MKSNNYETCSLFGTEGRAEGYIGTEIRNAGADKDIVAVDSMSSTEATEEAATVKCAAEPDDAKGAGAHEDAKDEGVVDNGKMTCEGKCGMFNPAQGFRRRPCPWMFLSDKCS